MFNKNAPKSDEIEKLIPVFSDLTFHAEGGQKFVYLGSIGDEKYVLKLIPLYEEYGDDIRNTILKRAQREVRIMEEINSPFFIKTGPVTPDIIQINGYEFFYYSEVYISGKDLKEIIENRQLTIGVCQDSCRIFLFNSVL